MNCWKKNEVFKKILLLIAVFSFFCSCGEGKKAEDPFSKSASVEGTNKEAVKIINGDTISFSSDFKLAVYVAENPDFGSSGRQLIENRLLAAISKVGVSGTGANPRFFIGPVVSLLSKNVTSTSPTKYLNTYEVTLLAVDAISQSTFASYTFTGKGVGDSPDKACINAFMNEKFDNDKFYLFLKDAESKILNYYNKNCDLLLSEAEAEAKTRNYSGAYTILNNIPKECRECFQKATNKRSEYFEMALTLDCQPILSKMKAEFGKFNDPSATGFNDAAMSYYTMIDPSSSCYSEAEALYKNHISRLNPKAKRDWDQQMKEYDKKVEMADKEFEFKREQSNQNFEYMKHKDEMAAKAEIEGNRKLLQKYNYDELPWIRRVFQPRQHVD